ncbi:MAG: hypothetical protein AAGI07_16155 [Bacteroidota bacterium]
MLNLRWDANVFWIVLFLILSTLFFLKTCYFDRNEYRRLIASSNRVVGIVHNIGISGDYYCSYKVNGIEYSFRKSKPYDEIVSGEKFMVAYEPGFATKHRTFFLRPMLRVL